MEIKLYARSLRKAAQTIIGTLDPEPNPKAWDACPVVLLYRDTVELHLKALAGEGSSYLQSPIDPITLSKTRSLRWLAQIVSQIIRATKREVEFKCEGIASLADFSALVSELEGLDPVSWAIQCSSRGRGLAPDQLQPQNVIRITRNLDALLDLLDGTTDALAATRIQRVSGGANAILH